MTTITVEGDDEHLIAIAMSIHNTLRNIGAKVSMRVDGEVQIYTRPVSLQDVKLEEIQVRVISAEAAQRSRA